jgi:hypothetical protein
MKQMGLWSGADDLDRAFWRFHRQNPHIYRLLVRYAKQAKAAGRSRLGIKEIFERVRWYVLVETRDPAGFKLNNNYHSRYARLIMLNEPGLAGLFETRKLKTASSLP